MSIKLNGIAIFRLSLMNSLVTHENFLFDV